MTERNMQINQDDNIDLLNIVAIIAQSWKLLVFGPLIAGLLAAGMAFVWPKTYESVSIVRLTEQELALLSTPPVQDVVINKFNLLSEFDYVQEDAYQYLNKKIIGKLDKKTGLVTVTATANTPERAQQMSKVAIEALLKELLPKGKNKDQLEKKILSNEGVIANNKDALEQLQKQIGRAGINDTGMEVVMKYYASLSADIANKELENIELQKNLLVKGDEIYVQQASLPQRSASPKVLYVASIAMLIAMFLMALFVFLRKAWLTATQDAEYAVKIEKIKKSLHGVKWY
jgi:capsular polysaccharide biosynthesis protein